MIKPRTLRLLLLHLCDSLNCTKCGAFTWRRFIEILKYIVFKPLTISWPRLHCYSSQRMEEMPLLSDLWIPSSVNCSVGSIRPSQPKVKRHPTPFKKQLVPLTLGLSARVQLWLGFGSWKWGRGIDARKTSDHQVDCTQVAPKSSDRLYLYVNRVFLTSYMNSFIIGFWFCL